MKRKREPVELEINAYEFPTKGIAQLDDGRIVSVKNTLPGQRILAYIKKPGKAKTDGVLVSVVRPSPIEQTGNDTFMPCKHFGKCGGCVYQTIPYEEELKLKYAAVGSLFVKNGISPQSVELLPAPEDGRLSGYRNKGEFSFGDEEKDGELCIGLRKRDSFYEVVNIPDCNIFDSDYKNILAAAQEFFRFKKTPFYHKRRRDGVLRHLVIRKAHFTGEILVNLVVTSDLDFQLAQDFTHCLTSLRLDGHIRGILLTTNDGVADVVKSDETTILYGEPIITELLMGLRFEISPFSFFQTNSHGATRLYSVVRDFAGDVGGKVVFDLYSGTGTITQIMAQSCKHAIGIEIVEEAVLAARQNARTNGLTNAEFISGDVLNMVDSLTIAPDLIILDPPREGIHPRSIEKIIRFKAREVIYVSCNPVSLVRDLPVFCENGYSVDKLMCVDMYYRTAHVESVVLMSRNDG